MASLTRDVLHERGKGSPSVRILVERRTPHAYTGYEGVEPTTASRRHGRKPRCGRGKCGSDGAPGPRLRRIGGMDDAPTANQVRPETERRRRP